MKPRNMYNNLNVETSCVLISVYYGCVSISTDDFIAWKTQAAAT